jgi:pyruvate/2-oxoglutarate dehydrogenase complex dihydrolipoamide dehydrogenase (E3) component/uncharacterized membrane protein YdjX (TVP38/TMEM64 family)
MIKKLALIALIITAIMLFFLFDLDAHFTLDNIKASQATFTAWWNTSPLLTGGSFFLFYAAVTALSLPGAALMTLLAGGLFGLAWGTIIVSFASTVGATLAFAASRYLFRDIVRKRFGNRLKAIDEGVERDGPFYLFTLRLVPIFPFFLINILMGLTSIKTITFYWVSQVGMLAGTLVYVNAGTQLARIESLGDIVSAPLLLSFALLGIFPLLAKKTLLFIRKNRVYKGYSKPRSFDRNLVVIGAGAAGLVSAYIAAAVNARVTLVEASKMGGDCLNYGCVPSKALIRSARLVHHLRHSENYGLDHSTPAVDFPRIMKRIQNVIKKVEPHDSVERYTSLGVEVIQGYARIIDPWTVEITGEDGKSRRLTTRSIIIATGAKPFVPPLPGLEEHGYLTSDTLWSEFARREKVPGRLVILGGGPIGTELSQSFARLGAGVTQVEMAPRILIREDEDVSRFAAERLQEDGVIVLTGHKALRVESTDAGKTLIVKHEGEEKHIVFDDLICAVGRAARLDGFGLEELGIPARKTVETNEYLETLYPNIYAAGDVAGPYQFTHTAAHQAWYAAVNALFGTFKRFKVDYSVIPWTTFMDPEVARVGLNEQEAGEQGIDYEMTRYDLADLDRAITDSADHGFIKVLTVPGKDTILGVTIVGEHGGELLAEFVLAMKHGIGLNKILGTVHTYPTFAEANKYAAGNWKRAHTPQKLLTLIEHYHSWRR